MGTATCTYRIALRITRIVWPSESLFIAGQRFTAAFSGCVTPLCTSPVLVLMSSSRFCSFCNLLGPLLFSAGACSTWIILPPQIPALLINTQIFHVIMNIPWGQKPHDSKQTYAQISKWQNQLFLKADCSAVVLLTSSVGVLLCSFHLQVQVHFWSYIRMLLSIIVTKFVLTAGGKMSVSCHARRQVKDRGQNGHGTWAVETWNKCYWMLRTNEQTKRKKGEELVDEVMNDCKSQSKKNSNKSKNKRKEERKNNAHIKKL